MDTITRNTRKGRVIYEIYSKAEAIDKNIKFKPWQKCQPGEYGLSDNDFVAMCIKRKEYVFKNKTNSQQVKISFSYPFGIQFYDLNYPNANKLLYNPDRNSEDRTRITSCYIKPISKYKEENVKNFMQLLIFGFDRKLAFRNAFNKWSNTDKSVNKLSLKIVKDKDFDRMLKEEHKKMLEKKGVSEKSIVNLYHRLHNLARETKSIKALTEAIEKLENAVGMETMRPAQPLLQLERQTRVITDINDEETRRVEHKKKMKLSSRNPEDFVKGLEEETG